MLLFQGRQIHLGSQLFSHEVNYKMRVKKQDEELSCLLKIKPRPHLFFEHFKLFCTAVLIC